MPTSHESDAVVIRTGQRRVDVTGADRLRYLDDVTTQRFEDASAGTATSALVLDAHGAPLACFDVAVLAERLALVAPDDEVAAYLTDVLGQRTFLLDVQFTITDDVVVALRGDGAEHVARGANLHVRPGTVRPAGNDVVAVGIAGGVDLLGPQDSVEAAVDALLAAGARRGDGRDLAAWRVAAGVPAFGSEITPPHLPEEAGILATHVHLAKGCYPGQEAVARMWMLGRPRRRLAVLDATGDGRLGTGWRAGEGRRSIEVTSTTPDGQLALAYVPTTATPGDVFTGDDGITARVRTLVGDDAVPPGHDPSVTRRRDRPRA